MFRSPLSLLFVASLAKLLFLPCYFSTDFEVHRNWLAITHSLPLKKWYIESTSEWTLDYPPFFAWFEYLLSLAAKWVDPEMLKVANLNYASWETIAFQKTTVILTELVLFYALTKCVRDQSHLILAFCQPALWIVDHLHFQYNGFLFGVQLLSVYYMTKGRYLLAALIFSICLNLKHIYLYQAPAYFIYLLSVYGRKSLVHFFKLSACVVAIFALSFGPFHDQLGQVLSRLFPFKRGLLHAYWAPNVWALYAALDRLLLICLNRSVPSMTRGIVGNVSFHVLPEIQPWMTFVLSFAFQLPILYSLWHKQTHFNSGLLLTGFSSFLFGWHVHEKAILMVLVPASLSLHDPQRAKLFYLLTCVSILSLTPLLYPLQETLICLAFFVIFYLRGYLVSFDLSTSERVYLYGIFAVYGIYLSMLNTVFLPLMLVSVYCSIGMIYLFVAYYKISFGECRAKRA